MTKYNTPNSQQIMEMFRPRTDAFSVWRNGKPVPERNQGKDVTLDLSHIEAHLRGAQQIGFYSTNRDDTCTWAAIDIDNFDTATDDAITVMETLQRVGFDPLLERSKSGKGYHIWLFFAQPTLAYKLRLVLLDIIRRSGIQTEGTLKSQKAFDRIFPNQDSINNGYGNLIAAPFWGEAVNRDSNLFIDQFSLAPYDDQLGILTKVNRITEAQIDEYIQANKLQKAAELVEAHRAGAVSIQYNFSQMGELSDIHQCEFIKYADERRIDLEESLWFALANNLAPFGDNGRVLFHALSEGHYQYTEKEANSKFDYSVKDIQNGKNPVGCKKLSEYGFMCPLLDSCAAKIVANYPSVYADTPMNMTEMQQYTHEIATQNDTSSQFRRFSLGWQRLNENDQVDILNQVAESRGWAKQQERNDFIKRMKTVRPKRNPATAYLPKIKDYFNNAPGHEELVLPSDYVVKQDKLYVQRNSKNGEIENELVAEQMLIIVETGHDYDRGEAATRTLAFQTALGNWEQVQVNRAESSDGRSLHKALGNSSFNMSSDQGTGIARYLREFESVNKLLLTPKLTTAHLGWVEINGDWEYIPYSNNAALAPKGAGDRVMTRPDTFAAKGNAEEWSMIFHLLEGFPTATFLIVAALTPPLLPALGSSGQSHTVAICGERGSGKSMIQKIGASLYGKPEALVRSWDATSVGMEQALALRMHMPAFYEDLQNATDNQVNQLVYKIFNQQGRERGAKEGGTRKTAEFQTIMIASAEADIREKAKFQGFLRRSLVVTAPVFGQLDKKDISEFIASLLKIAEENRGSFGRDWITNIHNQFLSEGRSEELENRLESWVRELHRAAEEVSSSAIEPTLVRLMAQHFVTAELLKDWYQLDRVVDNLREVWVSIVKEAPEVDIYRKYMEQTLEWAVREKSNRFTNGPIESERYGILTTQYVAVFPNKLEEYLRNINHQQELSINAVLADWALRGWIQRNKDNKNTVPVGIDGGKYRMVKILRNTEGLPDVFETSEEIDEKDQRNPKQKSAQRPDGWEIRQRNQVLRVVEGMKKGQHSQD